MKLEIIQKKPDTQVKAVQLLFLHGKWHGAWCWEEYFLPYFTAHGYDCTALSLRGHAGSEGHAGLRWYSIADYVSDVEQVAAQFDAPPVIIAHSMGAFIAQKYLETHNLPGAVLLTPVPYFGLWPSTWMLFRRRPWLVLKAIFTLALYPIVETPQIAHENLFSADLLVELVAKYQKQMQNESFRAYLDELGLNLVRPKRVKTPMLVIGAGDDTIIPINTVEATARVYGTQAEIFPDMAHDIMLEAGWEKVAQRILEWINGKGM